MLVMLMASSRCTAPAEDLDGDIYLSHSREQTELISAEFELGQLWDKYGLVGDIVVSIPFITLCSCFSNHW